MLCPLLRESSRHPKENLKSANVELTAADLDKIEKSAAAIRVAGERYPPHLTATTGH
ncbi:hypothetical protein [Bradyrhizobium sp. CCBAU 65884]|uniref:hypothetical protein n=1 Tax=Bradyrhizobium sp. CCBAU 65884 TaxID=722477 RepID=UPI002305935F|nr:hypothetical protein [Bradyrhizobium sp. CCBAU 65884]